MKLKLKREELIGVGAAVFGLLDFGYTTAS